MATVIVPTLHHNGTARETLMEQLSEAGRACRMAIEALAGAAPNQRDYYPQGDEVWHAARQAHEHRADALGKVYRELLALAIAIDEIE